MKRTSVFTQIALVLFLVSVVPVSLMIYYNGRIAQKNSEKIIADQVQAKLRADSRLSDEMLSNILYLSMDFVLLKQYKQLEAVRTYTELNADYESVVASLKINDDLENMVRRNDLIHSAVYYIDEADYVISSGGEAVIRKEDLPNIEWLKETAKDINGVRGEWVSQQVQDQDDEIHILSYMYRISNLYTAANGIIIINVYEDRVSDLLNAEYEDALIAGGLLDSSGQVISYSDKTLLDSNVRDMPYMATILDSKESYGWGVDYQDGSKILYTFQDSELYDWCYVNVYSFDQLFSHSAQKLRQSLILACGILLLGSMIIVSIAFRVSRSIRGVIEKIGTVVNTPWEVKQGRNEIEYLGQIVDQIKEQEDKLHQRLHEREDAAFRTIIQKLLVGEKITEDESELLDGKFPHHTFLVGILMIDDFTAYYQKIPREIREYHRWSLKEMVKAQFSEEMVVESGRYSSSSIAVILNIAEFKQSETMQIIIDAMSHIQKLAAKTLHISLSIGISNENHEYQNIWLCAEEAFEATKQRLFVGAGQILFYQEKSKNHTKSFNSYLYEKKIFNYLDMGDIVGIRIELQQMITEIKGLKDTNEDNIMLVFNQMIGRIMTYLTANQYSANRIFGVRHNLYYTLSQKETLDQIETYLAELFETITSYQKREEPVKEECLCNQVLAFLQQHYKEDVDFEAVADQSGISYSHLRKVIKQETGKSLIDNLNLIRIDAAKKELLETNESIGEIALHNGYHNIQALNRFFRKFEGMSPGEYREKYRA